MFTLQVLLLILSSDIAEEQEIPEKYRVSLVCETILDTIKDKQVACEIEKVLRMGGFGSAMVIAALTNSYAESKFNPLAIGDQGMSVGVFQLRTGGLGGTMSKEERQNVNKSTKRVIFAIRKSKNIKSAIARNSSARQLTRLFCTEIMRPSDKYTKAHQRAALIDDIFE